jgi:hypothetical protein
MSDGGKGSARRPGVGYQDNWEAIFGRNKPADDLPITMEPDDTDVEPEDDEDDICSACNGSGEGMYDGSTCYKCHGYGHCEGDA